MKAVSNDRGVIAAAAMDQRGSLKKSLAKEKGSDVSDHEMEEFKALVTEVLTKHASAILLDPEWGLPASKRRAPGSGLLLAYEKTGYDADTPGEEVVVVGDLAGNVFTLDAGDGHPAWSYRTGGFIYSSAAAAVGKLFV